MVLLLLFLVQLVKQWVEGVIELRNGEVCWLGFGWEAKAEELEDPSSCYQLGVPFVVGQILALCVKWEWFSISHQEVWEERS